MSSRDRIASGADILVVDDDEDAIWWMTAILGEAGHSVRPASDGPEALSSAKTTPPALVLLDVRLPGIDGYEVCRRLKADPTTAAVPVIFVSGSLKGDDKGKAFEAGGIDYITKPILREELLARVHTHLSIVRAHRELAEARDAAERATKAKHLAVRSLRATLYGIGDGVIATDDEGRVQIMNAVAEGMTGWTELAARGRPMTDIFRLVGEGAGTTVDSPIALVLREGTSIGMTNHTLLVSRDGSERPIAECAAPVHDDDGKVAGVVVVFRDQTTERRAASEMSLLNAEYRTLIASLAQSELAAAAERDQLRAVLLAAPAAIFVVDETGRVSHINPAAARLFGTGTDTSNVESLVGCPLRNDLAPGCGFGPACGTCPIGGAVQEGLAGQTVRSREMELDLQTDGTTGRRWVITNAEPLLLDGKRAAVVAMEDVTDRKRGELEREHLQASLTQFDRLASMGLLAAGVAHEVNNPLSYVLFNLESLVEDLPKLAATIKRCCASVKERDGDATLAEFAGEGVELLGDAWLDDAVARAEQTLGGVRRIRDVVRGLGSFSRVEDVKLSRVDVRAAMQSAISMARNEIKYRARLVEDLGEAHRVLASEGKLAQVFLNLLVNSAHAISEGDIDGNQISVRIWAEGGDVFTEVADTGCGIPTQNLMRVFDPFFTSKSVGKGSGLGLAICRNLVTEFGGDIRIDSEVGKGTRIIVRLPAAPNQVSVPPFAIPATMPSPSSVGGRVLVVDDEPAIRATMTRILGRAHEVVTAASGAEARAILEGDPSFDVILCDLMMPDMNGMDLHKWLGEHNAALAAKMVFVTGGAFTPKAAEYLAAAGNLRIDKPFDAKDVRRLVAQLILATRSTS